MKMREARGGQTRANFEFRVSSFVFFLFAVFPCLAQQPVPPVAPPGLRLTVDDVLRWRLGWSPAVSADGRRALFLVDESDFEKSQVASQLWLVDTGSKQLRRLTHSDGRVAAPRWSPDGRWISFLAARGPLPEEEKAQVWLLATDGGEAFPLTQAPEGVQRYAWAPDGHALYYVADEPTSEALQTLRDRQAERKIDQWLVDDERPRREIWRITVEEQRPERIHAGDRGVDEFAVSPDGRWLVYRSDGTGDVDDAAKFNLWLLDIAARRATPLTSRAGEERSPVWSPDSARVAFLAPRDPQITFSQEEVFVVALPAAGASEPPEPQRLTNDWAGAIERLHWPKGNSIYFAAAVRTENRLFALDPASGAVTPASPEKWYLTGADWTADGAACVAFSEGPAALPDLVVLRPASTLVAPQKLTEMNPQLARFALGAQEVVRWKSKDGLEIEGIITRPPGWDATKKYPLLLDVHGGPHNHRSNTMTTGHYAQLFAARGWMVLQPNFRGSTAYGHAFDIANRGDLGGKDAEDILAGVDFAIAQGWADPERLAVMGESYGGYMTDWLIARTQRFRVAASLFGVFNFITDYSNSEIPSWEKDYLLKYYWEDPALYLDRSPAKFVADIRTPVLILHGDADTNTFISNSREMYRALRALGRTVRFVRFPREGHGFIEPNHVRAQYEEILAWLDTHGLGRGPSAVSATHPPVRSGPWELRVAEVRAVESYGGVSPKSRFLEVDLLIRAATPVTERFALLLINNSGSDVWLEAPPGGSSAGGSSLYPEGLVTETLGLRLLARSQGQVVAIQPDRDGANSTLALTITFDVPAAARELLLHVKDFPPLRIAAPSADATSH